MGAREHFDNSGAMRRWLWRKALPYEVPGAVGTAWVIYASQKSALFDGRLVCPLVEPLIEKESSEPYVYVTLGRPVDSRGMPSHSIDINPGLLEALCAQVLAGWPRLIDLKFVNSLYGPQLIFPRRWRLFHVVRTWLLARHFEVKFALLAQACRSVNMTVYYNAPMLGLIAAFRRRGKPAWDVQHGYLGPSHEAYNNGTAFSLPSALKPDGFLVWDERFGCHVSKTLGAPWRNTNYAHLKLFLRLAQKRAEGRYRVLFSLQWGTSVLPTSTAFSL